MIQVLKKIMLLSMVLSKFL